MKSIAMILILILVVSACSQSQRNTAPEETPQIDQNQANVADSPADPQAIDNDINTDEVDSELNDIDQAMSDW